MSRTLAAHVRSRATRAHIVARVDADGGAEDAGWRRIDANDGCSCRCSSGRHPGGVVRVGLLRVMTLLQDSVKRFWRSALGLCIVAVVLAALIEKARAQPRLTVVHRFPDNTHQVVCCSCALPSHTEDRPLATKRMTDGSSGVACRSPPVPGCHRSTLLFMGCF